MKMRMRWSLVVLVTAAIAAGCAGVGRVAEEDEPVDVVPVEEVEAINHAAYEDFDPAPYRDSAPSLEVLEHDVPAALMEGRTAAGTTRTVDGYRIQLFQTRERDVAERAVEQATQWWRSRKEAGSRGDLFESNSAPVYNVWRQPFYRVRLGDFATEDEAEEILSDVRGRFDGAFIVPDRVVVVQ